VNHPGALYHGTAWSNLPGVLFQGLTPRRGRSGFVSPHRTVTTDAVFLTDESEAALGYAAAADEDPAVLEIDTAGLLLEPDYDDAGTVIGVDAKELEDALQEYGIEIDVRPGAAIPEDVEDEVARVLDRMQDMSSERSEPFAFSVEHDTEGRPFLAADPVVPFYANDSLAREHVELYDFAGLSYDADSGAPFLYQRQYLCRCSVPVSAIVAVWVPMTRAPDATGKRRSFIDYMHIDRPEDEDGDPIDVSVLEDEGRTDEIDFRRIPMVRLTVDEARQRFSGVERLRAIPPAPSRNAPPITCLAPGGTVAVEGEPLAERIAPEPESPAWDAIEAPVRDTLARRGLVAAERLACGGLGCAYAVEGQPRLVVKITGDPSEAAAAQKVVDAVGHGVVSWAVDLPALVRFVCVYAFAEVPLFAVVQERLASHLPEAGEEFVWKHKLFPASHRFAFVAGKPNSYPMRADLRAEADTLGFLAEFDRLLTTLDTLHRLGIEWHDLHTGNIMQDYEGHWRVLDLGESYTGNVVIPSFASILTETLPTQRSPWELRDQIIHAARGVCAAQGYVNCRLFAQLTTGTPALEAIPAVTGPAQVGDVIQWGAYPARHWAIFVGNGEVLEVPGWGDTLHVTPLSTVIAEHDTPYAIRRPTWGQGKRLEVPAVERLRVRRISPTETSASAIRADTFSDPRWRKRADAANTVLRSQGIVLQDFLGCGSYGCAFGQQPMVVKLTEDANEVANARTVMQRGGCSGLAQIFAVFAFDDVRDMYAVIMEKLEPITKKEEHFIWDPLSEGSANPRRIDSAMWELHHRSISQKQYDAFIAKVRAAAKKKLGVKGAHGIESLIAATECLYALGIEYADGHHGNVLARWNEAGERELVYFDLGHSLGPDAQVPIMERAP
jgi:hypothetical protein